VSKKTLIKSKQLRDDVILSEAGFERSANPAKSKDLVLKPQPSSRAAFNTRSLDFAPRFTRRFARDDTISNC